MICGGNLSNLKIKFNRNTVKNLFKTFAFFCFFLVILINSSETKSQSYQQEYLKRWESSARYTLEVLEKMPNSGMNFRVDSSSMSFGEQITHLGKTITTLSKNFLKAEDFELTIDPATASKLEIANYISSCYHFGAKAVGQLSELDLEEVIYAMGSTVNRRQVMALMMDHTAHHRGSAVVYLRIYGIEPPAFMRF